MPNNFAVFIELVLWQNVSLIFISSDVLKSDETMHPVIRDIKNKCQSIYISFKNTLHSGIQNYAIFAAWILPYEAATGKLEK